MKKEFDMFDLANFGAREIKLAADLLRSYAYAGQYCDGKQYNYLPNSWDDTGIKLAFNPHSGKVFLTNDDYQVLVDTDDGAAMWYSMPYYGVEGTLKGVAEAFINDATDADGKPLPPDQWGNWAADDYCDARYLLDIILIDAPIDAAPIIGRAHKILAALPDEGE